MNQNTVIGLGLIALAWWWLHPVTDVSVSWTVDDPLFDEADS